MLACLPLVQQVLGSIPGNIKLWVCQWLIMKIFKWHATWNLEIIYTLAALAQMVACLLLVQQVLGSIPGRVENFHLKIFNLGARRGGDVHFLIARLYITVLD